MICPLWLTERSFARILPLCQISNMRFLGIDYGLKKIGLAIGDNEVKIASPLFTIVNNGNEAFFGELEKIIESEDIGGLVIGVPRSVGTFHSDEQLQITGDFIEKLRRRFNLPVFEIDESFTSRESQRLQKEEGAIADEDSLAAMIILQAFLDSN
ncbi:Holliday junction resolvase RuvX [Candidatus Parcubacteria bacterium]|nr:MAG: Holliday junction resolvase RuvX [Candidatus Parcubacteria bacterium]